MKANEAPRKKIIGVNDDQDFCCCCGKSGLKVVVWIEDGETGEIAHFGRVCATKQAPALFGDIKNAEAQYIAETKAAAKAERARENAKAASRISLAWANFHEAKGNHEKAQELREAA